MNVSMQDATNACRSSGVDASVENHVDLVQPPSEISHLQVRVRRLELAELVEVAEQVLVRVARVVRDAVDRVLARPVDLLVVGPRVEHVAARGAGGLVVSRDAERVLDDVQLGHRDVLDVVAAAVDVPVGEVGRHHLARRVGRGLLAEACAGTGARSAALSADGNGEGHGPDGNGAWGSPRHCGGLDRGLVSTPTKCGYPHPMTRCPIRVKSPVCVRRRRSPGSLGSRHGHSPPRPARSEHGERRGDPERAGARSRPRRRRARPGRAHGGTARRRAAGGRDLQPSGAVPADGAGHRGAPARLRSDAARARPHRVRLRAVAGAAPS